MALTEGQLETQLSELDKAMMAFHKKWDFRDKEYAAKLLEIEKEFAGQLAQRKIIEARARKEMDELAAEADKEEQEREKLKEEWKKNKLALLKDVAELQKDVVAIRKELETKYLTDVDLKAVLERLKKLEAKK